MIASGLYVGEVRHVRRTPVVHAFRVPALYVAVELDELPQLARRCRLLGYNRRRLVTLRDRDHLHDDDAPLAEKVARLLQGARFGAEVARVQLVTMARVLGLGFNPVSFFLGHRGDGTLAGALVEVSNTYGERHVYLVDGARPLVASKRFFVSPFNDLRGEYRFKLDPPGARLGFHVDLWRDGQPILHTRLTGERRPLDDGALARAVARMPLASLLALPRIAFQALRLRQKGLKALLKPRPSDALTLRRGPQARP